MKAFVVLILFVSVCAVAQPINWKSVGVGGGGALFLPSFNSAAPGVLSVACDMSQEFVSTNYGASWKQAHFKQLQTNNNHGLFQYSNTNVIWTLDATSLNGSDTYRPTKSTDGGTTFAPLANDPTKAGALYLFANPNNAEQVIVADYKNIFLTSNGGTNWNAVYSTNNPAGIHIAGVCFGELTITIALQTGLLTSNKSGSLFTRLNVTGIDSTKQSIYSLTWYSSNSVYRFFATVHNKGDVYGGVTALDRPAFVGVFTTTSTDNSWTNITKGIDASAQPYFIGANKFGEVYVAGGSTQSVPTVFRTTDNGTTWKNVFTTTNNQNITTGWSGSGGDRAWSYGEYAMGFAVDYGSHAAAFTDYGFVHVTTNGGDVWQQAYVSTATQNTGVITKGKSYESIGLENTTCWHVVWLDSLNLYACFSDIQGCRSTDGGKTWGFNYTGHTDNSLYHVVKHLTTKTVYGATSTVHDMYQSTYLQDARIDNGKGKVLYSVNNGAAWQTLHDFQHPVVWLALDPTQNNRMYASVLHSTQGGVYVTNNLDAGVTSQWTKLPNPPRTEGHPFNIRVLNDGTLLATYSGRRNSAGQFTASSGVFVWNGTTWADKSDAGMNYWTKDVIIDPNDATQNTWYVAVFSGWGGAPNGKGGLYRTTNRGQSWVKVNTLDRVTSLTFVSGNSKQAYLTTETDGLWFTNDITVVAPTFTLVQSYTFRQPERVYFNPYKPDEVWVTSFGNGMKVSAKETITPRPDKVQLLSPENHYKNYVGSLTYSWKPSANTEKYILTITDSVKAILQQDTIVATSADRSHKLRLGKYFWYVRAINTSGVSDTSTIWDYEQVPDGVSVQELTSPQLPIRPNPTRNAIAISYTSSTNKTLTVNVFDELGRKVLTTLTPVYAMHNNIQLDVHFLSRGMYSVQLEADNTVLQTQQFIIE